MSKSTGSTADAMAKIEADNELRAMEAELASRKQAADNAAQDAALAAERVAAELLRLNPVTPVVVVPAIPAWQPTETLTGEQVRTRVAIFGRSMLDVITDDGEEGLDQLALLRSIAYSFEKGELITLLAALEKGSAIKAAPRHNADCLEYGEFLAAKGKPANCVAGCPMIGYKPPTVGGTSTPRASGSSSTVGNGSGHSAGKVSFVAPDGTVTDDLDCSAAARLAAKAFPTAARCIAWVANRDAQGPQASGRLPLMGDIARGNVPQGTFGATITTDKATPADAAYPFTPAATAAA